MAPPQSSNSFPMIETKVRIITDTTFYPVESDARRSNDDLTLKATLFFMLEEMKEDFQYFKADNFFIILQHWRGLIFFIQSNSEKYHEIMKMQLQTIREIILFLFGAKFEAAMRKDISIKKKVIFAQFIDAYLNLCQKDYLYQINSIRTEPHLRYLSDNFIKKISPISHEFNINLISTILFKNHEIISCQTNPGSLKLGPESLLLLSIYEQVEYEDLPDSNERFNPLYIKTPDMVTSVVHKNAFIRIEGTPIPCIISSARISANSPFVILVVTQNVRLVQDMKEMIQEFMFIIADDLSTVKIEFPKPVFECDFLNDLIHFVVVDRTRGNTWEMPNDLSLKALMNHLKIENEDEAKKEFQKITSDMTSYAMNAMLNGFTTMMWGEKDFHYCYELRFEDDGNDVMKPLNVFKPPPFHDDIGFNYRSIVFFDIGFNEHTLNSQCPLCDIKAAIAPTSTPEDAIMTVITLYKPSVGYLIRSIRSVGCRATIVCFITENVEIPSEILSCGVELVRIPNTTNRVSLSVEKMRWEWYHQYLSNEGKRFRRVMHTDGFDAFYFGDPFSVATDENVLYFQREDRPISSCPYNNRWVTSCHINLSSELRHSLIVCSGSLIGGRKQFLQMTELLITHDEWMQCWKHGFDQGDFNYVIYTKLNQTNITYKFMGCNERFISMHYCWPSGKGLGPSGLFPTTDDKDTIVYMHQYNRHKNIIEYIWDKCKPAI
ncbi:hypothetical protein GPJ56_004903 [Histomonas meleagridis]|uniref:uncharacterized protein n=1 Tax=Histomonas meleagridis TaxID=135588 RepID=UPI003559C4F6|nr:hypothetical protein GPJ56_004903 [Histomonas meleagridis]KAH0806558.1 hypothetical protein GO595_000720 [Histomonas meleagridis]